MAIGHEFVGQIVEVGSNVLDFKPGDLRQRRRPRRLRALPQLSRRTPPSLRRIPRASASTGPAASPSIFPFPLTNVWRHHDTDFRLKSPPIFDPFGNAVHTALTFPVIGEDVLITGAGPIGIMAAAVVRHCRRALCRHHRRQSRAARTGAQDGRHATPSTSPARPCPKCRSSSACRRASTSAWRCRATGRRSAT